MLAVGQHYQWRVTTTGPPLVVISAVAGLAIGPPLEIWPPIWPPLAMGGGIPVAGDITCPPLLKYVGILFNFLLFLDFSVLFFYDLGIV